MQSDLHLVHNDLELLLAGIEIESVRIGHQALAQHISNLCRLCSECTKAQGERAAVKRQFECLIEACAHQFRLESDLMEYSKYTRASPHRLDHERFLSLLDLHYRALERMDCASVCGELLSSLAPRWHQRHIRNHDLIMSEFVAEYLETHPKLP
jgi:hemerythrin